MGRVRADGDGILETRGGPAPAMAHQYVGGGVLPGTGVRAGGDRILRGILLLQHAVGSGKPGENHHGVLLRLHQPEHQ